MPRRTRPGESEGSRERGAASEHRRGWLTASRTGRLGARSDEHHQAILTAVVYVVDEQEVAADVAFAMLVPLAGKGRSSHPGPSGASLPTRSNIASLRRRMSKRPECERRSQSFRNALV